MDGMDVIVNAVAIASEDKDIQVNLIFKRHNKGIDDTFIDVRP